MKKFNEIETLRDLANLLNVPIKKITYVLYIRGTENLYQSFEIPKKSGGFRQINAPHEDLKNIQKKIASCLNEHQNAIWQSNSIKNNISHGFQKGKNIISNAEKHRNKHYVLNIDLEDFFGSFHFGRVKGFFEKNKYFNLPGKLAISIAQLVCFKGTLPQGSPSSPIIANFICNILDMKIIELAKKYKLNYTRYADDLSFSTNHKEFLKQQDDFLNELSVIVKKCGLKINNQKTRLLYRSSKQDVTGLVVNEKVNVDRYFYKKTRAMAQSLYTTGEYKIDGELGNIKQLEGRFSFINQLDWYNNLTKKRRDKETKNGFYNLTSREKQYQKFLFYKYFFANEKPLIITEGKTDISYIKSALKKMYKYYPNLISKNSNGSFKFKVSFLRRTKRLKHFLNITEDGADMMKNIYNYFSNKDNKDKYPNYSNLMQETGIKPHSPVILIFDNEKNNTGKPLKKFLNYTNIEKNADLMLTFNEKLHLNLKSNLHLVTHQLIGNKEECEIEDLFDDLTLKQVIDGKKFDRNNKHAKAKFANHISNHFEEINFNNFRLVLDNINSIVHGYHHSLPKNKVETNRNPVGVN